MELSSHRVFIPKPSFFKEMINPQSVGPLFIHWGDCRYILENLQAISHQSDVAGHLQYFFKDLLDLKDQYFWHQDQSGDVRCLTFWDVYFTKFQQRENPLTMKNESISFLGPRGPFKIINLVEIINKELFYKMCLWQAFYEQSNSREFRLRSLSNIMISSLKSEKSFIVPLTQLSLNGILINVSKENINYQDRWKIYLNTKYLHAMIKDPRKIFTDDLIPHPLFSYQTVDSFEVPVEKIIWNKSSFDKGDQMNGFIDYNLIYENQSFMGTLLSSQVQDLYQAIKRFF